LPFPCGMAPRASASAANAASSLTSRSVKNVDVYGCAESRWSIVPVRPPIGQRQSMPSSVWSVPLAGTIELQSVESIELTIARTSQPGSDESATRLGSSVDARSSRSRSSSTRRATSSAPRAQRS
jgi:hypothetical protein